MDITFLDAQKRVEDLKEMAEDILFDDPGRIEELEQIRRAASLRSWIPGLPEIIANFRARVERALQEVNEKASMDPESVEEIKVEEKLSFVDGDGTHTVTIQAIVGKSHLNSIYGWDITASDIIADVDGVVSVVLSRW